MKLRTVVTLTIAMVPLKNISHPGLPWSSEYSLSTDYLSATDTYFQNQISKHWFSFKNCTFTIFKVKHFKRVILVFIRNKHAVIPLTGSLLSWFHIAAS